MVLNQNDVTWINLYGIHKTSTELKFVTNPKEENKFYNQAAA